MANMQVAVRLGRKACLHAALIFVGLQVFEDYVANEVRGSRYRLGCCGFGRVHATFILYVRLLQAGILTRLNIMPRQSRLARCRTKRALLTRCKGSLL